MIDFSIQSIDYGGIPCYLVVALSSTESPSDHLSEIAKEINGFQGEVIFDYYMYNKCEDRRFFSAQFDGKSFDLHSFQPIHESHYPYLVILANAVLKNNGLAIKEVGYSVNAIRQHINNLINCDDIKMQNLLYYIKAIGLVKYDREIFFDDVFTCPTGALIKQSIVPISTITHFDRDTLECIDIALDYYGKKSAAELAAEMHAEAPWQDAYDLDKEVDIEAMQSFYEGRFTFEQIRQTKEIRNKTIYRIRRQRHI